jgi:hypothetical protein
MTGIYPKWGRPPTSGTVRFMAMTLDVPDTQDPGSVRVAAAFTPVRVVTND